MSMRMKMKNRVFVTVGSAGLALSAGAAGADVTPLFVLETAPLRQFAPHPLDAGIVRAIEMLPARVDELPGEIPGFERSYAQMVTTMLRTVVRPMRIAVVHDSDDAAGPSLGYGAVFSLSMADEAAARTLHEQIVGAMAEAGAPPMEIGPSGMIEINQPGTPPVFFGPHQDGDAWRYEARLNFTGPTEGFMPEADGAHGGNTIAQMSVDLRALTPMLERARVEAANEDDDRPMRLLGEIENAGFAGEDAIRVNLAMSYQGEESLTTARIENLGGLWDLLALPTGAIDRDTFDLVPADAWSASFSRFDLEMLRAIMTKLDEYGVPATEHVNQMGQTVGIDLVADIIEPLGGHAIVYTSESTGGGGLASTVMLMEVRDPEKMLDTNRKLIDLTNMTVMMVPYAGRYIRITPWEHEGTQLFSLRFPGTPIPLEMTFAYEGDWAVFAVTPQGAVAAIDQIRGDGVDGLGSVDIFTASIPEGGDLYSLSFQNSAKMFHRGYGTVSLLGSGLANLARSPWDRSRDPGMIIPPYGELRDAVRPIVTWSSWDGGALEVRSTGSSSMLANTAVMLGKGSPFGSLMGGLPSMLPAIMEGRNRMGGGMVSPAQMLRSMLTPAGMMEVSRIE